VQEVVEAKFRDIHTRKAQRLGAGTSRTLRTAVLPQTHARVVQAAREVPRASEKKPSTNPQKELCSRLEGALRGFKAPNPETGDFSRGDSSGRLRSIESVEEFLRREHIKAAGPGATQGSKKKPQQLIIRGEVGGSLIE